MAHFPLENIEENILNFGSTSSDHESFSVLIACPSKLGPETFHLELSSAKEKGDVDSEFKDPEVRYPPDGSKT